MQRCLISSVVAAWAATRLATSASSLESIPAAEAEASALAPGSPKVREVVLPSSSTGLSVITNSAADFSAYVVLIPSS